jgi:lipid II:glycine glycyltransferase (peptidoglycan interpeptide bridge formation enzyme)
MIEHTAVRNAIIRWTDRYFPEFSTVFQNFGKMALAVLEFTPFSKEIAKRTVEELVEVYRQSQRLKSSKKPKILKLLEAEGSIGVVEEQQMARFEIAVLNTANWKKKSRRWTPS